jgi:hypothetical protein
MQGKAAKRGGFRWRTIVELLMVAAIGYAAFQVGPAVKLRIDFLNAMEAAAHAPIEKSAGAVRAELLAVAEGYGLTIFPDNLYVVRSPEEKKTVITAMYEIHINFWPNFTYVWHVEDQVEGYLL